MGTLETIGVISGGDITQTAAIKYRDNVVRTLETGISLGSVSLPAGAIDMGSFGEDSIGTIQEQYPAWHGNYVNGFLKNISILLDSIPDSGILKNVPPPIGPIFDPTKPIAQLISNLQETFLEIESAIGIKITDVLISQIGVVTGKAAEIQTAITNADTEAFYSALVDTITSAFEAEGIDTTEIIAKLEEKKSNIEDLANNLIEEAATEASEFIPDLPIPELDLSFITPGLNTSPLFATAEVDGFDGIATKFIKIMTVFLSVPSKLIQTIRDVISQSISAATATIQKIADAILKLLTNFTEAISDLISAVIDFVWSLVSEVVSIASVAFLEISSVLNVIFFFAKCFVVVFIGFLLGSGMITLAAAKSLEII